MDKSISIGVIIVHTTVLFLYWLLLCKISPFLSAFKLGLDLSFDSSKYIFEEQLIHLNDTHIERTSCLSKTTLPLNQLINLCVLNDFIVLIFKIQVLLIPCTSFKNEVEKQKFITYIADKSNIAMQKTIPRNFNLYNKFP